MSEDNKEDNKFEFDYNALNPNLNNLYVTHLKSQQSDSELLHGQFLIHCLHPGQGISLGNILRRTLLGDIRGTAITGIRFAGLRQEFSTIQGLKEDVLELTLNLKKIAVKTKFKMAGEDTWFGRLKVQGPAVINASSIQLPTGLEIIDPNAYIATISTSDLVEMEFRFEEGFAYKLANQTLHDKAEDFLQLDAIFTPVRKVDFKIEQLYLKADSEIEERLLLNIWTNGSVTPERALKNACFIIGDLLYSVMINIFTEDQLEQIEQMMKEDEESTDLSIKSDMDDLIEAYKDRSIDELELSTRPQNCLKRAKIYTIGTLLTYSLEKILEIKNFGKKSADEVSYALKTKFGIVLE